DRLTESAVDLRAERWPAARLHGWNAGTAAGRLRATDHLERAASDPADGLRCRGRAHRSRDKSVQLRRGYLPLGRLPEQVALRRVAGRCALPQREWRQHLAPIVREPGTLPSEPTGAHPPGHGADG